MFKRFAAALAFLLWCSHAWAVLAVDGFNSNTASAGSLSISITTSNSNDVIVVECISEASGLSAATVSSISGGGLSWSKRAGSGSTSVGSVNENIEHWYAIAASSLSSASITINFSLSTSLVSCIVFGVSGANTASPWDANASIPKLAISTSASIPTVTGVSTTNANTMIFGFAATNTNTTSPGLGFTIITSNTLITAEEQIFASAQSSITVPFGGTSTGIGWLMYADAIQASGGSPTCHKTLSLMGVGC